MGSNVVWSQVVPIGYCSMRVWWMRHGGLLVVIIIHLPWWHHLSGLYVYHGDHLWPMASGGCCDEWGRVAKSLRFQVLKKSSQTISICVVWLYSEYTAVSDCLSVIFTRRDIMIRWSLWNDLSFEEKLVEDFLKIKMSKLFKTWIK